MPNLSIRELKIWNYTLIWQRLEEEEEEEEEETLLKVCDYFQIIISLIITGPNLHTFREIFIGLRSILRRRGMKKEKPQRKFQIETPCS
jgi:hypothetical protein